MGLQMNRFVVSFAIMGLSVTSALSADLPARVYTKAPPIEAPYSWAGFYLGVNAGVGLGHSKSTSFTPALNWAPTAYIGKEGAIGGGQIGYNWQFGTWVLGLETDIQAANMRDDQFCGALCKLGITPSMVTLDQRLGWFGTTRARVGLAAGPILSYVTGGFAYGGVKTDALTNNNGFIATGSFSETRTGYSLGSGVEAALGGNWTGKLEYLYVNLGSQRGTYTGNGVTSSFSSDIREHIFRVGLNYRIGGNAAYAAAPVANWNGFYVGGNGGGALARNKTEFSRPGVFAFTEGYNLMPNGYIGGVQAGYNWQASNWVLGVEADIQGSTAKDDKNCMVTCFTTGTQYLNVDQRMDWFGTVRGRVGYSVGSTLFYGTAGLAYGNVKNNLTQLQGGNRYALTFNHTKSGWTAGGGIETPFELFGLFGRNWTVKTEYLYVNLGTITDAYTIPGPLDNNLTSRVTEHVFRTGLNYHFNSPVVAKY